MNFRRKLFPLLGICVGLLFALIICEIALRIIVDFELLGSDNAFIAFMQQAEEVKKKGPLFLPSEDPQLGVELKPNSRRGHIRINSNGFRGREYDREVPAGVKRIAIIGDSETFGAFLKDHETLSESLELQLNRMSGSKSYEVLNFGVPGYNTSQEFALLKKKVIHYHPSLVILYYVFNDPIMGDRTLFLSRMPFSRSYLYVFITWAIKSYEPVFSVKQLKKRTPGIVEFYQELHGSEYFEATKRLIQDMGEYLHERKIRFIIVIAPEIIGYDQFKDYPYKNIHEKLGEIASERIEVVDPLTGLISTGKNPKDFWVYPKDCHKNPEANHIIANIVAEYILANPSGMGKDM